MKNIPNKITLLRVLVIPVLMWFLLSGANLAALALFLFSSLTDFFDGFLARRVDQVSPFGKFADPIADKILISTVFITFVQLGDLSAIIVVIIVAREFLVTGLRLMGVAKDVVISASWLGKIKTVSQMVLIVAILVCKEWYWPNLRGFLPILEYIVIATTLVSGADYLRRNSDLISGAM